MLIALPPEHRTNFRRLQNLAKWMEANHTPPGQDAKRSYSYCLLRFYAAESGLKYLLHKMEKIPHRHMVKVPEDTEAIEMETIESFGHNLARMARRLKVPATTELNKLVSSFKLSGGYKPNGSEQSFQIERAHEAWRYGLVVNIEDQTSIESALNSLLTWIEQQTENT